MSARVTHNLGPGRWDPSDWLAARIVIDEAGCWIWQGRRSDSGYAWGQPTGWKPCLIHRWTYSGLIGPIPEGLTIDHLCRVPLCVNPDHLEPVTIQENIARRPPTTHCRRGGHEYTPENTAVLPRSGVKVCITCRRARRRAAYAAARQAAKRSCSDGPPLTV